MFGARHAQKLIAIPIEVPAALELHEYVLGMVGPVTPYKIPEVFNFLRMHRHSSGHPVRAMLSEDRQSNR